VEPNSEEERDKFANDHLLGAIYCFKRPTGCQGVYREVTIDRTAARGSNAPKKPATPSAPSVAITTITTTTKTETKATTESASPSAAANDNDNDNDNDDDDDDDDTTSSSGTTGDVPTGSNGEAAAKKKKRKAKKKKKASNSSSATPTSTEEHKDAIRRGLKDQRGAPLAPRGILRCSLCDDIADEKNVIELEAKIKGITYHIHYCGTSYDGLPILVD
jgi:hypothetical protein